jgi:CRISPR system Cascade subunit CasE
MTLYLTRIRLSTNEAAKLRLTDAYAWHRKIWEAFPSPPGQPRDFLCRVDRRGGVFHVLVLSPRPPQLPPWGTWETRQIPARFFQFDRYVFSLRANPTQMRVVRTANGKRRKNGRRTGIFQPAALRQWIARKLEAAGCQLEQLAFDPPVRDHFYRKGRRGTHLRVDFRGVLRVQDRQAFFRAVQEGIGRARAFGFGMLLLRPLAQSARSTPQTQSISQEAALAE